MAEPVAPEYDAERLRNYVNASSERDRSYVEQCWTEAGELIANAIGPVTVPPSIAGRARLEVGAELFHRRQAPNGISNFADGTGNPVRVARDPMVAAWPLLRPYVGLGIG